MCLYLCLYLYVPMYPYVPEDLRCLGCPRSADRRPSPRTPSGTLWRRLQTRAVAEACTVRASSAARGAQAGLDSGDTWGATAAVAARVVAAEAAAA